VGVSSILWPIVAAGLVAMCYRAGMRVLDAVVEQQKRRAATDSLSERVEKLEAQFLMLTNEVRIGRR